MNAQWLGSTQSLRLFLVVQTSDFYVLRMQEVEKQFFLGMDMDRTIRFLKDACVRWTAIMLLLSILALLPLHSISSQFIIEEFQVEHVYCTVCRILQLCAQGR